MPAEFSGVSKVEPTTPPKAEKIVEETVQPPSPPKSVDKVAEVTIVPQKVDISVQKEEEPTAIQAPVDTANIEEAVRLTLATHILSQNFQSINMYAQQNPKDSATLARDINLLLKFMAHLSMNPAYLTLEDKINCATEEFLLIVKGSDETKVKDLGEISHHDFKSAILRIANHEVVKKNVVELMMSGLVGSSMGAFPLASQPIAQSQTLPSVSQLSSQEVVAKSPPKSSKKGDATNLGVVSSHPRKDLSKSPLRQPGALQEASSVARNIAADWGAASEEDDEDLNAAIGAKVYGGQHTAEDEYDDEPTEEKYDQIVGEEEKQTQEVEGVVPEEGTRDNKSRGGYRNKYFEDEAFRKTREEQAEYRRGRRGGYRGRGGEGQEGGAPYERRGGYRGRGGEGQEGGAPYEKRGGYRGRGGETQEGEAPYRGERRGGYRGRGGEG